jgi:hypothetical protein
MACASGPQNARRPLTGRLAICQSLFQAKFACRQPGFPPRARPPRAVADGVGDVATAVGQVAGIGQKQVATTNLTAVVGDATRHDAERCQPPQDRCCWRSPARLPGAGAHSLAFAGVFGVCATTSGASGAMPRVRSELPITAAKTGAATSPP